MHLNPNAHHIKPATGVPFYIEFKYERLPTFCFICGLIGHNDRSCDELFEGRVKDTARNYGPELRATGRRSQPNAGQQWMLAELPRRRPNEETTNHNFSSDSNEMRADTLSEETKNQREQSTTQVTTVQSGDAQRINENLTPHGNNLMHSNRGKNSWPELVGVDGFVAKATVESENSLVEAELVYEKCPVTLDFRCNRVRIGVDCNNLVIATPVIG
nr:ase inhibitor I13, potato inhibitor I [Ipomoea batatas]